MNHIIYFNCKKLSADTSDAIAEYAKRLSSYCKINWYCKPAKDFRTLSSTLTASAHTLWIPIQTGASVRTSEELAAQLDQIGIQGISTVCFFIGYDYDDRICDTYAQTPSPLSLSSMDISLELTGVVLFEQLYRSYRIIHQQPYHK